MVRFDVEQDNARISINLSPERRKKGLSAELLQLAEREFLEHFDVECFVAEIKHSNVPSIRLFESQDYVFTEKRAEIKCFEKPALKAIPHDL